MIRKAVLPVAGFGTRCLPASKAIPKEMITIVDRPVIQYVVQEAVEAGIRDIVLVTHGSKSAIENHFDKHFELEASLEAKGKQELLEELRSIVPEDVNIISVRQSEPLGLGHAVLCARPVIGDDEPFAVLLPDVLVDDDGLERNDLAGMIEAFDATGRSQLMVEEVPHELVYKYGIVAPEGEPPAAGEAGALAGLVEKPKVEEAPSDLAVPLRAPRRHLPAARRDAPRRRQRDPADRRHRDPAPAERRRRLADAGPHLRLRPPARLPGGDPRLRPSPRPLRRGLPRADVALLRRGVNHARSGPRQ